MVENEQDVAIKRASIIMIVFAGVMVLIFAGPLQVIPEGNVGVKTRFGQAVSQTGPGLKLKIPFVEGYQQLSTRSETYTMSSAQSSNKIERDASADDAIDALTQEGLNIEMDMSVRYHMMPDKGLQVFKNLGTKREILRKLIRPTIRSAVRSSTSEYSVNSIYSDKRDEFAEDVEEKIAEDFYDKGFVVERVQVRNVMLPQKVRDAIQQKEATQQMIEAKENEIEVEKKEKERKIVEAEAIAESNKIIGSSLSSSYLRWYWIQNLDSHDSVMYVPSGQGGMPIMKNVDNVPQKDYNVTQVKEMYKTN